MEVFSGDEMETKITGSEQCLCCEVEFAHKVDLFRHVKTDHWPLMFDVLMMGPGRSPVGCWIDQILRHKNQYDGSEPIEEKMLNNKNGASGQDKAAPSSAFAEASDLSISYFDSASSSGDSPLPDQSNSGAQLDETGWLAISPSDQCLPVKSVALLPSSSKNEECCAVVDDSEASTSMQVPEEKRVSSCTLVDGVIEAADSEKIVPEDIEQEQDRAGTADVNDGGEWTPSAETNVGALCCRLCGEAVEVEERLRHVLQAHLRQDVFQCRECQFSSHSRPDDIFNHISSKHPGDVRSLNLFWNRLDEHRVGIDQLLLDCLGIDDPAEQTAVMCGSTIRGFLDGLEFFRRSIQADSVTAPQLLASASQAIEPEIFAEQSDALDDMQLEASDVQQSDGDAVIAESVEPQEKTIGTAIVLDASPSPERAVIQIEEDESEPPTTAALQQMDNDDGAEIIFTGVVEHNQTPHISDSLLLPRQTPVEQLRNEFRFIDTTEGPVTIGEDEEAISNSPPLSRRTAQQVNRTGSVNRTANIILNLEAEAIDDDERSDERSDEKSDDKVIAITIPVPESPTPSALRNAKQQICRVLPTRRSTRITRSSSTERRSVAVVELIPNSEPRSLRQTPGRQAMAAEQRTLLVAAQLNERQHRSRASKSPSLVKVPAAVESPTPSKSKSPVPTKSSALVRPSSPALSRATAGRIKEQLPKRQPSPSVGKTPSSKRQALKRPVTESRDRSDDQPRRLRTLPSSEPPNQKRLNASKSPAGPAEVPAPTKSPVPSKSKSPAPAKSSALVKPSPPVGSRATAGRNETHHFVDKKATPISRNKIGRFQPSMLHSPTQSVPMKAKEHLSKRQSSSSVGKTPSSKRQALKRPVTVPRDRSNDQSRRLRTLPSSEPPNQKRLTLRSRPAAAVSKATSSATAMSHSAPKYSDVTVVISPTDARKSLRVQLPKEAQVDVGETPKQVGKFTVLKSASPSDTSTTKLKLRTSDATPSAHQSTAASTAQTPAPKDFTCRVCGAVMKLYERMRHIRRNHVQLPIFACPVAECTFTSRTEISHCRQHIINVHKDSSLQVVDNRALYKQQIDEWMQKCV